jgi:hypothetical protein
VERNGGERVMRFREERRKTESEFGYGKSDVNRIAV